MEAPSQPGRAAKPGAASRTSQTPRHQKRPRVAEENRQRATKACTECRRLKEKCEGGYPCARCVRTKRICGFSRSGPASQSNSSSLGSAALRDQERRIGYLEQIAKHFLGDVSLALPDLKRISEGFQSEQTSIETNATELDIDEFEDLKLEDETFSTKGLSEHTAYYSGEFSHWNFSQRVQKRVDEELDDDGRENSNGVIDFWRATQLQSPDSTVLSVLNFLPPRPVVEFLVRVYFRYAQTNSFFVEERWLRGKVDLLYDAVIDISSSDSSWICAVLMVFAIGSQFAHMDVASSGNPTTEESLSVNGMAGEEEVGVAIYHMASKLIPDVLTVASLESVQACLLLAHYSLPLDTHGLSYTYLGMATRLAIQNGMHRKYTGQDFDAVNVESRNRIWWTAYTLERRVCILHGRPLSLSSSDVDADLPADLAELRPFNEPSAFANMSALIHLTNKLGDIANTISLLRKCPKSIQPKYFNRVFDIQQQLRSFWSSLPGSVVCRDLTPQLPLFRHNIHLTICFHLNDIYVGRPFIFSDPKASSPAVEHVVSPQSQSSKSRARGREVLVSDAVNAAIEIVKLCKLLEENCGLARASYTEFTSCRAALLVILAQSLNERAEHLKSTLEMGVRLIKSMAVHIASAKSDVSIIEALEAAINRLEMRGAQRNNEQQKDNGYDQFKNWALTWKNEQEEKSAPGPLMDSTFHMEHNDTAIRSNWEDFELDFDSMGGNTNSTTFQFDNQMLGIGLDDILIPFQPQPTDGEIDHDHWQNSMSDLDPFNLGHEFKG